MEPDKGYDDDDDDDDDDDLTLAVANKYIDKEKLVVIVD